MRGSDKFSHLTVFSCYSIVFLHLLYDLTVICFQANATLEGHALHMQEQIKMRLKLAERLVELMRDGSFQHVIAKSPMERTENDHDTVRAAPAVQITIGDV